MSANKSYVMNVRSYKVMTGLLIIYDDINFIMNFP